MRDLRPRPEQLVAALAIASLALSQPVLAQVGLGAERYEVTITPPKRPGSETAPAATPPGAAAETAPKAAGADTDPVLGAGAPSEAAPSTAPAPDAKAGAVSPNATASAEARVNPNLPQRTLQVGAFRQRKSAESMRDKLAATFADVVIVEIQSGGEALYRVNVGRLPRGPGLDDLRRRLVAAGYPAFDVAVPAASSTN
jgi:cell division protein FtsN